MVREIYKDCLAGIYRMKQRQRNSNKRGAIGLSIETLVIIIISLVILSAGITLIYQFISGAEEIKGQLDQKTQDELERLLVSQGKKVALPLHVATVRRGDSHVFGIGILNTFGTSETFFILTSLNKVADEFEHDITSQINVQTVQGWVLYNTEGLSIESNGNRKESLLVQVSKDAVKGQYIFLATVVLSDGSVYGNPQTFMVTVI